MDEVTGICPDISVLRRVLLATEQLPRETPSFWEIVTAFRFKKITKKTASEKVRMLVENTEVLDSEALKMDTELLKELIKHEGFDGRRLGIVLISSNSTCKLCGGNLIVRADQPSFLTGYTNTLGTVPMTHFRKYCSKAHYGCSFTQHYGWSLC